MKFYNYIQEKVKYKEPRSKDLSQEECYNYLENNCMQTVRQFFKGEKIYRGSRFGQFRLTKPSYNRKSANTSNYYTLIFNNDKSWSKFPKRELICTYNIDYAKGYGTTSYNVFPVDNSKLGICPVDDIWASFKNLDDYDAYGLDDFNKSIENVLNKTGKYNIKTYKDLKNGLSEIDKNSKIEFNEMFFQFKKSKFNTLYDFIIWILDPKRNGFSIESVKNFVNIGHNELWTDKPSILISSDWLISNEKEFVSYFKDKI